MTEPLDLSAYDVIENEAAKRFEIHIGEHVAFVDYMKAGSNIIYSHTDVPPALEGNGVGSKLAKHVLDYAVANGYKVQPLCPFIARYVREHEEYKPHVWHT